jgi:hypothetical protein
MINVIDEHDVVMKNDNILNEMYGEMIIKLFFLIFGIEIIKDVLKHGIGLILIGDNGDIQIVHDGLFMVDLKWHDLQFELGIIIEILLLDIDIYDVDKRFI